MCWVKMVAVGAVTVVTGGCWLQRKRWVLASEIAEADIDSVN